VDKSELIKAGTKLANARKKMEEAEKKYYACVEEWKEAKKEYERLDYQAAITDGRFKVIEPQKKGGKVKQERKLTKEEMAEVLAMI